ncbi:MAG: phosphoribosyltransferase family protein, partial [Dehalococcoidales bacterium]|nr:phosphoribosyltransferase family protein [Dehalococcoidales bacterium]
RLLADELRNLRGQQAVVLGIPRGGIVIARELAAALEADLDIVLARKLRTPGHEELAMGAIAEGGKVFLNEMVVRELGIKNSEIEQEKTLQLAEIARRAELIRHVLPRISLQGRPVVVTDDGVATGATFQAALWTVRQEAPAQLIAAIPVGSGETVRRLAADTDEMVCLQAPLFFAAVGQFYLRFQPIEDEEVLQILRQEYQRRTQKSS